MSSSVSPCKISPCRHRGSREPYVDSIDFRYGASCGICSKNGSSMKTATKRRADHRERIEFTRESSQSRSGLSPSKVVDGHRGQTWAVSSESPRSPLLGPKNVRLYRSAHPGRQQRFESRSRRRMSGYVISDVIRPVPPALPLRAGLDASDRRTAVLPWLEPFHPPGHAPRC